MFLGPGGTEYHPRDKSCSGALWPSKGLSFLFLAVLEFEFRSSSLLGRPSTT
jgi:hypothetical protein